MSNLVRIAIKGLIAAALAVLAAIAVAVAVPGAANSSGAGPGAHPATAAASRAVLPPTKWTGTVHGSQTIAGTFFTWTATVRFDLTREDEDGDVYLPTGSVTYTYGGGGGGCTDSGSDTFAISPDGEVAGGGLSINLLSEGWAYAAGIEVDAANPSNIHEQCPDGSFVTHEDPPDVLYMGTQRKVVPAGTGSLTGTYQEEGETDYKVSWTFTGTPRREDLTADPGGPYTVKRGGRVALDGSGSRPRSKITDYIWTFRTIRGDCEDVPPQTGRKRGRVVNVVALCGLVATLTVVDRHGNGHAKSTVVNVKPRHWRTPPLKHREKTGDPRTPREPPSATSLGGGDYAFSLFGGLNVSDCGGSEGEILCPLAQRGKTWLGNGYELAKVDDPNGPFDGFSYVASSHISVKRAALINPSILPGSAFYRHNLAAGNDVAGFVNAIRQHEGLGNGTLGSGHSLIMKTSLQSPSGDPRRVIEELFAPGRNGAQTRVDKALGAIERRLDKESEDPLPDIWTGTIDFYDSQQRQWIPGPGFRIPGPMRG